MKVTNVEPPEDGCIATGGLVGKFWVGGDFMTGMVMCARTPFFFTTPPTVVMNRSPRSTALSRLISTLQSGWRGRLCYVLAHVL